MLVEVSLVAGEKEKMNLKFHRTRGVVIVICAILCFIAMTQAISCLAASYVY